MYMYRLYLHYSECNICVYLDNSYTQFSRLIGQLHGV